MTARLSGPPRASLLLRWSPSGVSGAPLRGSKPGRVSEQNLGTWRRACDAGEVYALERSEPSWSTCPCCGDLTIRLTRFVYRDGDAFAVYYVQYSNGHPDSELAMVVSLGAWGEGSLPRDRAAFFCRVRATQTAYEVMLGDVADSPWSDVELLGAALSGEQARAHPWKATAFEVLDSAFEQDPALSAYLRREQCGAQNGPLDFGFAKPDELAALGDDPRVRTSQSFARLGDDRFFVRVLLEVEVEYYGTWSVGTWVEVSKEDSSRIGDVWDHEGYRGLRFAGTLANDLHAAVGLEAEQAGAVECYVTDPDGPPRIDRTRSGPWAAALLATWSRVQFEAFAVPRHML